MDSYLRMPITVQSPNSWFNRLGGAEIKGTHPALPYRLKVLVAGYSVSPRHSMFEYFLETGRAHLDNILRHLPFIGNSDKSELLFVLPERWLSVHEQQAFLYQLQTHPEAQKIRQVNIVTQEVLIVGGVQDGCLALFQLPEGDPEASLVSGKFPR